MIAEDEDREPDKVPTARNYTVDEVVDGLLALTDVELATLDGISKGLASTAGMGPRDLFHEALHRMVTTRKCTTDISVMGFAIGTMKSIASTAHRRRKREADEGTTPILIAANDGGFDLADDAVSPEDEALSNLFYAECLERVEALIADDEELQLLVMGLCDGLLGKQLEEALDTDTKGLAAARKRLANRLRRAFPNGAPL
ncbi:hypothetical protein MRBLMA1_003369 [Sphingobium sp. LMA1-1-1.1]|uniref:hypothetical protein n=1 Tax=Sphingobium sp. LMA1-1-1.1 TaxID=3135238 RepID=UPI00341BAB59